MIASNTPTTEKEPTFVCAVFETFVMPLVQIKRRWSFVLQMYELIYQLSINFETSRLNDDNTLPAMFALVADIDVQQTI